MLGALMEAELQSALLSWMESWGEFVKAWAKVQRARGKRGRRR